MDTDPAFVPSRVTSAGATGQRGFTLLEAIVALVLTALLSMGLYGWINSNLISLRKIQSVSTRVDAIRNALDVVKNVNPALRPTGELALQDLKIHWDSVVVEDLKEGVGYLNGISFYQVGFYKIHVQVSVKDQQAEFNVLQIGYKKVRNLSDSVL